MLNVQLLRTDPDRVRAGMEARGLTGPLELALTLDAKRRQILQQVEALKARRNEVSKRIGQMKVKPVELIAEMRTVGDQIKALDEQLDELEAEWQQILLQFPNLPDPTVPRGKSAADNVERRRWGTLPLFPFPPRPHWEIGEQLGIIDFERGVKLSGTRFYVLRGWGARLERALINYMLDVHLEQGYTEVLTPFVVKREALIGTGQLPKFEDQLYHIPSDDLFLIPTAEVPVTNLHAGEILAASDLPIKYAAYSPCFRREAGEAGRDTRGVIRVHQFNKVEMVRFCAPADSPAQLEELTQDACTILEGLGIPYRVVELCTGDLGFAACKTYDLEAWLPGQNRFVEISSCSNFSDFQARRAGIRYRPEPNARPEFVHTLNGSGLAVGRTLAAVLENYQQADGTVRIPEVLRPYLGGAEIIR